MDIDSLSFFTRHWAVWKLIGFAPNTFIWKPLIIVYFVLLQIVFSFAYSLHLGMSMFRNENFTDDIKNLTTFAVCCAASFKSILYALNFNKILEIEELLKFLDSRVSGKEETEIYLQLKAQLTKLLNGFIAVYLLVGICAELSFLFQSERGLMYPAWIPFDWRNSTRNYYLAHTYQIVGISFQLTQNWSFDCYPALILCLISGHIQMLYKRFEGIGLSTPSDTEAHAQLEACINDHKKLLELFKTMESLFSLPLLIQFGVTAMNVCISLAAFLIFVTDPMGRAYFLFYSIGVPLQIFPTCYYGTDTELWFGKLHYAAFSCNWISQNRSFKKKLLLFVECSLRRNTPMAAGMVRIHVDTVFSTLKFAYSLFTILLQMRK